jgi:hypothetical protein
MLTNAIMNAQLTYKTSYGNTSYEYSCQSKPKINAFLMIVALCVWMVLLRPNSAQSGGMTAAHK